MARTRTFIDSCSLIKAFRGTGSEAAKIIALIEDPERQFISTSVIKLEVLPKPTAFKKLDEVEFYNTYFDRVDQWVLADEGLMAKALDHGCRHALSALDSLHVAAALDAQVEEFITDERASKPFFQVPGLNARHASSL
jgi:predicted nucleic acid-binding protein